MTLRGRLSTHERIPREDVMVDACFRCGRPTSPTVVASDLERDGTVGGYVCAGCGASWFTSYTLAADELAEVLAARGARVRA